MISKDRIIVWLIITTALAMVGGCGDNPRNALPTTARDIHEYSSHTIYDCVYFLKAKITPEEFEAYRTKLKFVPIPETMKEEALWFQWGSAEEDDVEWWDPLPTMEGTFYDPTTTGSHRSMIKYERGYVYYWDSVGIW